MALAAALRRSTWPMLLAGLMILAGCMPGKPRFGVVSAGRRGMTEYTVGSMSDDWRSHRVPDADYVFINRLDGCSIFVSATCDVEGHISPVALTNHLLIDMTDREVLSQDVLVIDGREGMRTEVKAKLDGAPIQMCIYVVQIDSCVYDLALISHPDNYPGHLVEFEEFMTDFHVRRGGGE